LLQVRLPLVVDTEDAPGTALERELPGAVVQVVTGHAAWPAGTTVEYVVVAFGDAGDRGVHEAGVVAEPFHAEPVSLESQRFGPFVGADGADDHVITDVGPQQRRPRVAVLDRGEHVRVHGGDRGRDRAVV